MVLVTGSTVSKAFGSVFPPACPLFFAENGTRPESLKEYYQ
jgi:hypothetical protein